MKKLFAYAMLSAGMSIITACTSSAKTSTDNAVPEAAEDSIPTVYHTKEITPESLIRIYEALGRKAQGNNVAVKISTGESNKSNHLDTALIRDFITLVNGTIIECNTAYGGNRSETANHLRAAEEHGFTSIARVDIMDADGDTAIAVNGGKHLTYDLVGKNFMNYDFVVVLSHFKGHQMGGFGGALKNISIGIASSGGKAWIHTAGRTSDPAQLWNNLPEQDDFLESMAEASKAVTDHIGDNILYINVANKLSVDCDCNGNPEAPKMADLGILASLDPVALDRACVDMVFNSTNPGKEDLIERINSRHGTHILDHAEKLGIGSQKYRIVTLP
ncbi:MAG: DUF362 domain-containing protein [Muribaculaceae bacterium]|nr:DUF362 domain-containing protein [Muribaculaceae bacterium]